MIFFGTRWKPAGRLVRNIDQNQHDGHFGKNADNGRECRRRLMSEKRDRNCNLQFKKVGGSDHAGRCRNIMRKFPELRPEVGDKENQERLDDQRCGYHQNIQRL